MDSNHVFWYAISAVMQIMIRKLMMMIMTMMVMMMMTTMMMMTMMMMMMMMGHTGGFHLTCPLCPDAEPVVTLHGAATFLSCDPHPGAYFS